MTSFIYLKFAVLLVHLSWVGFAQNNSTSSTEGKIVSNLNLTVLNQINTSNICKLRMDESAVENILTFMHNHAIHVVEINVFIDSKNETRSFPELVWPWANEIGRTIISLKARTGSPSFSNITKSSLHFITLNPGIEKVNVVVSEENYGCLPKGSYGSELVFDFLLHQLSHSDDTHDYKLCRAFSKENDSKQYNCCKVASGGKLTICGEYSSLLLKYATIYINVMTFIFVYVGVPLIWFYVQSIPKEKQYYEITDSPMGLSTIFFTVFMEGSRIPVKSLCRRLAFSLTAAVIISISFTGSRWIIASFVWALIFTAYDFLGISEDDNDDGREMKDISNYEMYLLILTLPFNIEHWWNIFKLKLPDELTQSSSALKQFLIGLCFALIYLPIFGILFVVAICFFPLFGIIFMYFVQCMRKRVIETFVGRDEVFFIVFIAISFVVVVASVVFSMFSISAFLNLMLYLITGVYLNGSFYCPFVVPILVFLGYFWKNWRSFVETNYLILKTTIHEVCKERKEERQNKSNTSMPTTSSNLQENEENTENNDPTSMPTTSSNLQENEKNTENSDPTSALTTSLNLQENTENTDAQYTVNVKEGTVSKALYDKIRKIMLPYNVVLFSFFVRMFFVANFCLIIFVMMLLAQESNIAAPAQIMSTIIVSTFPLIFDTIWAANSFEQKNVNAKKLEHDLDGIMKLEILTDDVVTVEVEGEEPKVVDAFNRMESPAKLSTSSSEQSM